MKNWSYYKKGWSISWYNIKNELDDSYNKKFNEAYKNNPDKYFKKVFRLLRNEYGIEYVHMWNTSHILWQTPIYIYIGLSLEFLIDLIRKENGSLKL